MSLEVAAREPARAELLERTDELLEIEAAMHAARTGAGSAVVIEATPGMGKTALVRAARDSACDADLLVLAARGTELDQSFPFGALRQLFVRVLREADGPSLLEGPARVVGSVLGLTPADDEPADPSAVAHGVYWLLADLAERRPLAVMVDDLQWVDPASRHVLGHVCARLEEVAAVALLATRPDDGVALDLDPVLREPSTRELRPGPLSARAVLELTTAAASGEHVAPEFADACREISGGNPFLLRELLREMAAEGVAPTAASVARVREIAPKAVQRSVLVRLARLPDAARRVARCVAVLPADADLALVGTLAGLERDACIRALRALVAAHVLTDGAVDFPHPLMRTATYQDMPSAERAELHRAAATTLRERGAPSEEVAVHLLRTAPSGDPAAAACLHEAGAAALSSGAVEAARDYLARAVREPPATNQLSGVLADLGRAQAAIGDASAIDALRAAFDAAPTAKARADVAFDLAEALIDLRGDGVGAVAVLWEAIEPLPPRDDRRLRLLARLVLLSGRYEETIADLSRANQLIPDDLAGGSAAERECLAVRANYLLLHGAPVDAVKATVERAVEGFTGDPEVVGILSAVVLRGCGDLPKAVEVSSRTVERAERQGRRVGTAGAMLEKAFVLLRTGDLRDAEALTSSALALLPEHLAPNERSFAAGCHARILVERGKLEEAAATIRALAETRGSDGQVRVVATRAALAAASGEHDAATDLYRRAVVLYDQFGDRHPAFQDFMPDLAHSLAATGNAGEALKLLHAELARAVALGAPAVVGWLTAAIGFAQRDAGRIEEGVALLRPTGFRLAFARATVDLGTVLRLSGRPRDAREHLREGLQEARAMGAGTLAKRAESELRAAGGRVVSRALTGAQSLTPSELRIARMAAEGATNKEIAQRLFLTRKTVEMHLGNTYRKLDISSRGQLAEALA